MENVIKPMTEEQALNYNGMAATGYGEVGLRTFEELHHRFWSLVYDVYSSDLIAHLSKENHEVAKVRDLMLTLYAANKAP